MQFCIKCKGLMVPFKKGKGMKLRCAACGYSTSKHKENLIMKEKIKLKKEEEIEVVDKNVTTLPKTDEECPKCGHSKAYYWLVQTRGADEAATRFFRCTKCGNTWRDYS